MLSAVFWTYNFFIAFYWRSNTEDHKKFLRRCVLPLLVIYFHGFSAQNVHHIFISEIMTIVGIIFKEAQI